MILKFDCNIRCWECNRECEMKQVFEKLPEPIFNKRIIDSLKSWGGRLIIGGLTRQEVDEEIKKQAVALSISRKKYLQKQKK